MLHIDDDERLDGYSRFLALEAPPALAELSPRDERLLRMLVASLTTRQAAAPFEDAVAQVWANPQVRAEVLDVLELLRERVSYVDWPLGIHAPAPIMAHARYTRPEILAGFGIGRGAISGLCDQS